MTVTGPIHETGSGVNLIYDDPKRRFIKDADANLMVHYSPGVLMAGQLGVCTFY